MAYRFTASTDVVEFALAPFSGYTFGPCTMAVLLNRSVIGGTELVAFMDSANGNRHKWDLAGATPFPARLITTSGAGLATGTPGLGSTGVWYLLAVTWAGGAAIPRFHLHDGTSWTHASPASTTTADTALVAGDRLCVGRRGTSGTSLKADVVCVGIKKADRTDLQIETLSRTAFSAWAGFGFDWLIGFDTSLVSGGVLQDQASPGTGDQIAITGTSVVADPAGWSWSLAAAPVADFTGTPLTGAWPLSVAFTDSSTNTPTSWAWTFGDGGTSTSQNPSHTYATAGTYTVALTATNAGGLNTKTRTGYVTVANPSGSMTKIKWGTNLVVTDEGSGVIRADVSPAIPAVVNGQWVKGVGGVPVWVAITEADVANLTTDLAAKEATVNKGAASGYASLDSTGKVPTAQLPPSATSFLSGTGSPTAGVGVDGAIYLDTAAAVEWGPKAAGAWPAAPIRSDTAWHLVGAAGEPPFLETWGNVGSVFPPTRFRQINGIVYLQVAVIRADAVGAGSVIFVMPAAWRQAYNIRTVSQAQTGVVALSDVVASTGNVRVADIYVGTTVTQIQFAVTYPI